MVEKRVLRKPGEAAAGIASGSELAEEGEVSESVTFTNEELREFLGRRRQTDQVHGHPSEERHFVGGRSGMDALLFQPS